MDKKKILVIDDEEILTKTISKLIERAGYEVFITKAGADAIEMSKEEMFDLIITDVRMPGMDGIETIQKFISLRKDQDVPMPPFMFISGYADLKTEQKIKELAPAAYLKKPFDIDEMLQSIKNAIGE